MVARFNYRLILARNAPTFGADLELADEFFDAVGPADVFELDLHSVGAGGGELQGADAEKAEEAFLNHVDGADIDDADFLGVAADDAPLDFDTLAGDVIIALLAGNDGAAQRKGSEREADDEILPAEGHGGNGSSDEDEA